MILSFLIGCMSEKESPKDLQKTPINPTLVQKTQKSSQIPRITQVLSAKLTDVNTALGPLGINKVGLFTNGSVIFNMINNGQKSLSVSGIKICQIPGDKTDCTLGELITTGMTHSNQCSKSSISSGAKDTIYCDTGIRTAKIGEKVKIKSSVSYIRDNIFITSPETILTLKSIDIVTLSITPIPKKSLNLPTLTHKKIEGLSKTMASHSEINAAVEPLGIKHAGLYANSTLILRLINNKADTIAISGIKVCDATTANCNLPADATCADGVCHITDTACTVSKLASRSEDTIYCQPTNALWTGANPGDQKKVTIAITYSLGGVPGTTTATTLRLNAL